LGCVFEVIKTKKLQYRLKGRIARRMVAPHWRADKRPFTKSFISVNNESSNSFVQQTTLCLSARFIYEESMYYASYSTKSTNLM